MSMLAERRRKQKWAVDPQNTAWSNDESKFGQRMLEKMGWSKGKGLGAQEQGATEHIRVRVKNNNLGLGATVNNEDNWIAHQDDFNQLLAALNSHHRQEAADASERKGKKSFSLEEKSRISRSRVHYMKFTKGKDLSSRSTTDLDCIFGKRHRKKTPEDDPPTATPDASGTTTSTISIHEYFAQRMAALKGKALPSGAGPDPPEAPVVGKGAKKRKKEAKDRCVGLTEQPEAKEQSHDLQDENTAGPAVEADSWTQPLEDTDEDTHEPPKIKKRKGKKQLLQQVQAVEETPSGDTAVKKKKKKKKKKSSLEIP
ncbi:PIN2/TERF1-interacting telomerase inhibitor 1 [Sorex araneus]|uniref:PIN2/TERF1-interacting telomerase inhibitor 1 n=1 Tax=Sorex araneus TaxID=42254 RepID=UPI002433A917|nr:PIN2/TERF1-interacting telomerase inhibitor 1 [Sorex araneus]